MDIFSHQNARKRKQGVPNPAAAATAGAYFYDLIKPAPLYKGCESYTDLSWVIQMLVIKSDHGISRSCFDTLIDITKRQLRGQENVQLPDDFDKVKKMISKLGMTSITYDSCVNDCMLYYGDKDKERLKCKHCDELRYKTGETSKLVARKQMHYFPLVPRLKRLYGSKRSASHMRWHAENKRKEGVLCHPSDGKAWKKFDEVNSDFASDPRNVRLGLYMDEFKPFNFDGNSCWPVIVTPYNLSPEMCLTTPYMFLTCLIPRLKNSKDKIDVYMRPLIDELKILWTYGVKTWDISKNENFQMRAVVMWTINDILAYEMLSGWTMSGELACPICMEKTKGLYLEYERKMSWFDCHRKFLKQNHSFRKSEDKFTCGKQEQSLPPQRINGHETLAEVISRNLRTVEEMGNDKAKPDGYGGTHLWTKKSIFWELPYWKDNLVRHNLNIMHIENNVFDNIFNTVMNIKWKTKDNVHARRDIETHCKRPELHLKIIGDGKYLKPKATYCLSEAQKKMIFKWIKNLKKPDTYTSNLSRCGDNFCLRLHGTKSQDCHAFMQRLLPTAFSMLPSNVWNPVTELTLFFKDLYSPELQTQRLEELEENIPLILCKLEQIFPPSFFDFMTHMLVHLPYETLVCGPIQYRLTYPFERFLHDLKGIEKTKSRFEASICEAYLAQETTYFATYFFEADIITKKTTIKQNESIHQSNYAADCISVFKETGRAMGKCVKMWLGSKLISAHAYALMNCDEVLPIIEDYKLSVRLVNPDISEDDMEKLIETKFAGWFNEYVHHSSNSIPQNHPFVRLSLMPSFHVKLWKKYEVNGYTFCVNESDDNVNLNSGVCWMCDEGVTYYGVLMNVIQLLYPGPENYTVTLFDCKWYNTTSDSGIRKHPQYGIVEINVKEEYPLDEPYILAQYASQVFYLPYPEKKEENVNWRVVINTRPKKLVDHRYDVLQEPASMKTTLVDHIYGNLVDENAAAEKVFVPILHTSKEGFSEEDDEDEDEDEMEWEGVSEEDDEDEDENDEEDDDEEDDEEDD